MADTFVGRHPITAYFLITFAISWTGALCVAAPYLLHGGPLPRLAGILMFPVMLAGPSLAGVLLTRIIDGKPGLRKLAARLRPGRVPARWYATLLIPPALVLTVLFCLERFASSDYGPNRFWLGVLFGVPAGFLEEIGWSGYAFPKMRSGRSGLAPAISLGVLWCVWHLPVIDYLGAAAPHGSYLVPFFLAFLVAMTAIRVLICWIYTNTNSVWMTQLMHVSSTGALVIFGAPHVSPAEEATWYAVYGASLWVVVAIVLTRAGRNLGLPTYGLRKVLHADRSPVSKPRLNQ